MKSLWDILFVCMTNQIVATAMRAITNYLKPFQCVFGGLGQLDHCLVIVNAMELFGVVNILFGLLEP